MNKSTILLPPGAYNQGVLNLLGLLVITVVKRAFYHLRIVLTAEAKVCFPL